MNQQAIVRPALVVFIALTLVVGVAYPLAITGAAQVLFPAQAGGSLVMQDGKPVGSELVGRAYSDPKHFWGRPSATSPDPYNAAASSGSNQGPLNPALLEAVKARVVALRAADPGNQAPVPVDLVTASASGLDPHISPAAARFQVARVAKARGLPLERVSALVEQHVRQPGLPVLGDPYVNVQQLNRALDALRAG